MTNTNTRSLAILLLGLAAACGPVDDDMLDSELESPASPDATAANLVVSSISHTDTCGTDGYCTVSFTAKISNTGGTSANSSSAAAKWNSSGTYATTCSKTSYQPTPANAISTTNSISAGSYKNVTLYGPGYVGSKVKKGSSITVYVGTDFYCAISETSDSDNMKSLSFKVGG